uniref:Snurportin-1 n=1 Tax=Strongyloides papillosus TaxID=174720 RepID=A0A0N5B999_STREA
MFSSDVTEKKKPTSYCIKKRKIGKCISNLKGHELLTEDNITTDKSISFYNDFMEEENMINGKDIIKKEVKTYNSYPIDHKLCSRMKIISNKPFWWMNSDMEDGKVSVPMQVYELGNENDNNIKGIKKSLTYYIFPNMAGVECFPRLYSDIKDYQLGSKKFSPSEETFNSLITQWYSCLDENIYLWRMKKIKSFYMLTSSYTIYFGENQKIILNGSTLCCRKKLKEINISYDIPPSLAKLRSQFNDYEEEKSSLTESNKKGRMDLNEISVGEIGVEELNELKGTYPILINPNNLEIFINLLKDKSFTILNYGIHCHLPPTILSSEPFCNSTIKELTISSRIVKYPSQGTEYHLEINDGPILPHVGEEILKYLYNHSSKDDTVAVEISFYGKESYSGLNTFFDDSVNVSKIRINNIYENIFNVES